MCTLIFEEEKFILYWKSKSEPFNINDKTLKGIICKTMLQLFFHHP